MTGETIVSRLWQDKRESMLAHMAIIIPMRLESIRLPRKLMLRLGSETLAERAMRFAVRAANHFGVKALVAICEEELIAIAKRIDGLEIFDRSRESAEDHTDGIERFAGWADRLKPRFDWVLGISPCQPFLTMAMLDKVVMAWRGRTVVSVRESRDLLFYRNAQFILPMERVNKVTSYQVVTHSIVLQPVETFNDVIGMTYQPGQYDLCVFENGPELLDIHTLADFRLAYAWWLQAEGYGQKHGCDFD